MKRITTFLLVVAMAIGVLVLPVRTQAAAQDSKAGAVTTKSSSLNVRASASTGARVVSTLKKGSYITLLSNSGSWWKVEYGKQQYGYCHKDYITVVEGTPAAVATNASNLNVRSGPGTSHQKIGSLAKGEWVILLSSSGGWSHVLYHGTKTGYVSSQYLSGNTTLDYRSISLKVPSFKQTDARWANVKIGNSGKTIGQIGCATTAIAMMESYRTGSTIYPDAMSKKLRYTSSGNVYWPSNFVSVNNSSGYLGEIYRLLSQGKPVLLGAKKSSGGQHWVVITGFAGGNLTASNFTIHDPGTNARTTLQQFLNAYSVFYKYFYYQ